MSLRYSKTHCYKAQLLMQSRYACRYIMPLHGSAKQGPPYTRFEIQRDASLPFLSHQGNLHQLKVKRIFILHVGLANWQLCVVNFPAPSEAEKRCCRTYTARETRRMVAPLSLPVLSMSAAIITNLRFSLIIRVLIILNSCCDIFVK